MTDRRRTRAQLVAIFTLWSGIVTAAAFVGWVAYTVWAPYHELRATQRRLAYHTDHAALISACRDVWQRRGDFDPSGRHDFFVEPEDPKLPPAIRNLDPKAVYVSPSGVRIELGGGFVHHGFNALVGEPTDADVGPLRSDADGCKQVADGLWYYSENGVPAAD